jgi:hypothetical protein
MGGGRGTLMGAACFIRFHEFGKFVDGLCDVEEGLVQCRVVKRVL